jgi:hypothetical protein
MWLSSLLTPLNLTPQGNTASNSAMKATMEEPIIKQPLEQYSSAIDKLAWQYCPLTKEQMVYAAVPYVIGKPLYDRHVNTSQFGEVKVPFLFQTTLSPQIDYSWKDQPTTSSMLVLKKSF